MRRPPCSSWQAGTLRWAGRRGAWRGWASLCCSTAQQPDASATKGRSAAGHPDSQHGPPERQRRGFWVGDTFKHLSRSSRLHSGNRLVHGLGYLLNSDICRQHLWTFLCHAFIEHWREQQQWICSLQNSTGIRLACAVSEQSKWKHMLYLCFCITLRKMLPV